jgi:hypothetical protein
MHKSSNLTFVYKYIFTPVWGGGFLTGILASWNNEDQFWHDWSRGAAVMLAWALIWLIILMIRLRNIEADESQLIIKSFNEQKSISYKDIEYISQPAMISPELISIKYRDPRTMESRNVLIIPSTTSEAFKFKFLEEHEMTKFIRTQIIKHNPGYSPDLEPSRWRTVALVFLTGIPAMIYWNWTVIDSFRSTF